MNTFTHFTTTNLFFILKLIVLAMVSKTFLLVKAIFSCTSENLTIFLISGSREVLLKGNFLLILTFKYLTICEVCK